jgi:TPR repeat protein
MPRHVFQLNAKVAVPWWSWCIAAVLIAAVHAGLAVAAAPPANPVAASPDEFSQLKKKGESGDAAAQLTLGKIFETGDGVPANPKEAQRWYKLAAAQGNAAAQFQLGALYDAGEGVARDAAKAFFWFKRAAEQGDSEAEFNVGQMLEAGTGTPRSVAKAADWYRKAAEKGNARAQNNLGNFLRDGKGVAQNAEEAKKWYQEAAEHGNSLAQFNLGVLFFKGKGVDVSYLKWLTLAMNGLLGHDAENYVKAQKIRELLMSYMTPTQIEAGEKMIHESASR